MADLSADFAGLKPSTEALADVVRSSDELSRGAFGRIKALSSLVRLALESPRAHTDAGVQTIADAMDTIEGLCDESASSINALAESVGCNHVATADDRQAIRARYAALDASQVRNRGARADASGGQP